MDTPTPVDSPASPVGEQVDPLFIKTFGNPKCKYCCGTGEMSLWVPTDGPEVRKGARARRVQICGCTFRRLGKAHGDDLVVVDGTLYWRTGKGPGSNA